MIQEILANDWQKAGVDNGDVLLVHSSIRRTLARIKMKDLVVKPKDILESFLLAVGSNGTLLLPLFNFDFTKNITFDINTTPSHMGVLTEVGRLHPLAVRTGHPIYSFAVIGYQAERFQGINNFSGYDSDSPFAMLKEMNGKIAVLDLPDQNSMTFYHHVEEMHEVPYRYHKTFTGDYRGLYGNTETRTYGLFVRDIEKGVLTHVNPAGELMWKNGLYSGYRPNEGCGLRTVSAHQMFDFVSDIILTDRAEGILYRREGKIL